jgi:hypothetical protein
MKGLIAFFFILITQVLIWCLLKDSAFVGEPPHSESTEN